MSRALAVITVWAAILWPTRIFSGVVQGVVLEHASGRPMARAILRIDPVPSPKGVGTSLTMRAGRSGQFTFPSVQPGFYTLVAVRDGYFPVGYGQHLTIGRGVPFEVTKDSTMFAELRLKHKSAVTGRILDENGVGVSGVPVVAYRAKLPLRIAGSGVSDDRGAYRVYGLEPGKYWVRSGTHTLDDQTNWGPTFGPSGREPRDAAIHHVPADSEAGYADVSPQPGLLFRVTGALACDKPVPVVVIISSELGRYQTQTQCFPVPGSFRFDGLSPGYYEIVAIMQDASESAFSELSLGSNTVADLSMQPTPKVTIDVRSSTGEALNLPVKLIGRRQDQSESEPPREIQGRRPTLPPGYWEMRAIPPPGYFVSSIVNTRGGFRGSRQPSFPSDWFEAFVDPQGLGEIRISLSADAGRLDGLVTSAGKPVAGAPVYAWPVSEAPRLSLGGFGQAIADTDGRFQLENLPPGDYRIVASFDVVEVDQEIVEVAQAPSVSVKPKQSATIELPLWAAQ